MYRNISYFITDDWQGKIRLDTWDENGIPITKFFPHQSYLYYENSKGKVKSIFGTNLVKKTFRNVAQRNKWIRSRPHIRIFESLTPVREFLINYFEGQQETPEFIKYPLKIQFLDIEIAIEDIFPEPKSAEYPINVMTIYDTILDQYHTWTFSKETFENYENKFFHCFNNEKEMLNDFLKWFINNRPDIVSGWNIENFDIPYLINRLKIVVGEEDAKLISSSNKLDETYRRQKGRKQLIYTYKIEGLSCLDYYNLYKKFDLETHVNHKLETIAQDELGYGKLNYEGSIREFYKKNFRKFVEYNIHDVKLCKELDEKLNYISLSRKICNIGLCEYEAIYKSMPYIYGALVLESRSKNLKIISDNYSSEKEKKQSYIGAYVFEPRAGIYKKGVASLDLNSLYPNTMITLNISPETKVGKIVETVENDIQIKLEDGRTKTISNEKLKDLLEKRFVKSSNNVLYIKPNIKMGIIPSFLEKLYNKRISLKKNTIKLNKKIRKLENILKDVDDKDKIQKIKTYIEKIEKDKRRDATDQGGYKIFLNSIYGQIGSKYFPMFDIDNAEAVTLSGQHIIKRSSKFVDEYFRKKYDQEFSVISGDTDSIFINVSPFVKELIGNEDFTRKNINKICKRLDEFVDEINDFCFELTQKDFCCPLRRIEFKRETFCTEAAFLTKKRYVLHIKDDEGVGIDKFKHTGNEVKKQEIPKEIKEFLKNIIENSLKEGWNSQKYKEVIDNAWEKFSKMKPDELAFWKGYNTKKESEGFLNPSKGTGIHAKASMYYNQIIEKFKLKNKYEEILLGDRVRYMYINKSNPYGIEVIGWKDEYPKEFQELFEPNYYKMFEKILLSPLENFEKLNGWKKINPSDEELFDISLL